MDGHILNFRQCLVAVLPDPHVWDQLTDQFRTPPLGILRTGLCKLLTVECFKKCIVTLTFSILGTTCPLRSMIKSSAVTIQELIINEMLP